MVIITAAKERIVSVADRIFDERGSGHVTIRTILRESEQHNMSAVKYYFGDREGLLAAVFRRRRVTLGIARTEYLDAAAAEGRVLDVRNLVEAVVYPIRDHMRDAPPRSDYARFAARLTPRIDYSSAGAVATLDAPDQRIVTGLRRSLAHLPDAVAADRIDTAFNMIVGALAAYESRREESLDHGPATLDALADTLVDMVTAGLTA
ncbi:TetR family transcriptional regulator [Prescottella defluvii]|uniref:TetR/AcrR family transcriptional regulator n=1 Tax=Prescottella defluvii TaxID=1323361 RepID=UPI0004F24758